MKFIFWLLALFAAAVALVLAAKNPGYVLVVYPPYDDRSTDRLL
jgi:HemY protein